MISSETMLGLIERAVVRFNLKPQRCSQTREENHSWRQQFIYSKMYTKIFLHLTLTDASIRQKL